MFWRIWVRRPHPSNRPLQGHACVVAVAVDGLNELFVANATNVTAYTGNYTGAPALTFTSGLLQPVALAILP